MLRIQDKSKWTALLGLSVAYVSLSAAAPWFIAQQTQVPTTLVDFTLPGTQPNTIIDPIQSSPNCATCHGNFDPIAEPLTAWSASMMGQAGRDPIFYAALAIANQDADFGGELCLRCHAPGAWLAGRSTPTNGSGLDPQQGDLDGVNCHFCHRMVDPIYGPGNPVEDAGILAALSPAGLTDPHTGSFIIDPEDRRRGPYDLGQFFFHPWRESPFHRESLMCATCHDVSNPVLELQPNGSWQPGPLNAAHPTANKHDMFPIERTYSEWALSVFAQDDIETGGRFGGDRTAVGSCQDCHMPDLNGGHGCNPILGAAPRSDLGRHHFSGANSWVLRAIRSLYPDSATNLSQQSVDDAIDRNEAMLRSAADLELIELGDDLVVRVTNMGGHKLPTGYGEGRRMWLNVRFYDGLNLVAERGHYDYATATLTTNDTAVYAIDHGLDAQMAQATGLPAGKSFHFILNNVTEKDNRIPARGFRAQSYARAGAHVVGAAYEDEQYWSEVAFDLPGNATRAEVRLFHQTTSKEYITFLRDENVTDQTGQTAFGLWSAFGMSEPVEMALTNLDFATNACLAPRPLALGKRRGGGARAALTFTGSGSRTARDLVIQVTGGAPSQVAVLFMGRQQASDNYVGGVLNVGGPLIRTATLVLDGSGAATIPVDLGGEFVGADLTYQLFFRDTTDIFGLGMTGGLRVDVCE